MKPTVLLLAAALVAAACGDTAAPATTIELPAAPPTTAPATTTTASTAPAPPSTTTTSTTTAAPPETTTTTGAAAAGSLDDVVLALEAVPGRFDQPVFLDAPAGDARLFVVDQPGVVWVLADGEQLPFLDIRGDVAFGGERGLLGLAFHPDFAATGRFYVDYTDAGSDTRVVEYRVSAGDPNRADPASARVLLEIDQPANNHNGGMLAFGPDGLLYVGLGDGGGANDRYGHGQRRDTLLATITRIDVDTGAAEVWAHGLRNPWRFSFDGDAVWIGDVGQNRIEEIDAVPVSASQPNLGWSIMEGTECFESTGCDTSGLVVPVHEYGHGEGCSVSGGYVYRGAALPELAGQYFFGDFCTGFVRSLDTADPGAVREWTGQVGARRGLTSFGTDGFGELYVLELGGGVWRVVRG